MSGLFTINLGINSGWKSTLAVAFSKLRAVKFAVEDTFTWTDFNPLTSYNGMVVTNYVLYRARYLKIANLLLFSIDIVATVAAPLTNKVTVTLPFTTTGLRQQTGGATVSSAGAGEAGSWSSLANTNLLDFFRTAQNNYAAGSTEIVANGFLEIN